MAHHLDDLKAIPHRFVEEWNKGNLAGAMALFDENVVDHNPAPGQAPGKAGVQQGLEIFRTAFPDLKLQTEFIVAEGDRVADHGIARGTHKGPLFGIPPTGKRIEITYSDTYRVQNGKIVEAWHVEDIAGIMQQIGAAPAPAKP
jgi:steroid delta-isomerase-like uncharacterized protein